MQMGNNFWKEVAQNLPAQRKFTVRQPYLQRYLHDKLTKTKWHVQPNKSGDPGEHHEVKTNLPV